MTASSSFQSDQRPSTVLPRASVVIPTYNRRAQLERVLSGLGRQTVSSGDFEVIVVADGCTDGTGDLCRRLSVSSPYTLRLIEQENAGPAAARDRAVHEAAAALIVFIDDDVVPDEHLLAVHFAAHTADGSDDVVALGPLLPPQDQRLNAWGAWEERALCTQYDDMIAGRWKPTYRQFYTGNASLARRLILNVGGFSSSYRRAEDVELGLRLDKFGCQFVFLPEARGWHYVHRTFASWIRMPIAYGRACVSMGRAHRVEEVTTAALEYHQRNLLVRTGTALCVGSPIRLAVVTYVLGALALLSWTMYLPILTFTCCSVIYNVRYFAGLSEELGGARLFWMLIAAARSARPTPPSDGQLWERQMRAYTALLAMAEQLLSGGELGEQLEQVEVGASR